MEPKFNGTTQSTLPSKIVGLLTDHDEYKFLKNLKNPVLFYKQLTKQKMWHYGSLRKINLTRSYELRSVITN